MDPVAAIANGIGSIFDFLSIDKASRTRALPPWLRPTGDQDSRASIAMISGVVVLLVIIVAIVISLKKKA